jgi:hypothetical protein
VPADDGGTAGRGQAGGGQDQQGAGCAHGRVSPLVSRPEDVATNEAVKPSETRGF